MSLLDHQCAHANRLESALRKYGAALDGSDTGTGKTYVALEVMRRLGVAPLVIGPKAARRSWRKAGEYLDVPHEFVNYEKVRGMPKATGRVLNSQGLIVSPSLVKAGLAHTKGPDEAVAWKELLAENEWKEEKLCNTEWLEEKPYGTGSFIRWKQDYATGVFDEVHRCAAMTSLQSKMLISAKRQFGSILALSATAADDPTELKALGYVLGLHDNNDDKLKRGFRRWMLNNGVAPGWRGGYEFTDDPDERDAVLKRIHRYIYGEHGSRMRRIDIPNFPQTQVGCKLFDDESGKAARLSGELKELYDFRNKQALDADGMLEVTRLRQKLELLKVPTLVDESRDSRRNSKLVFFVNFTETLVELRKALEKSGLSVGYIDGTQTGKSLKQRDEFCESFQRDELDAIVANSQAGSESISLHGRMDRTTYITPVYSAKRYVQIAGRVQREGGGFSQQWICLFADTVEEDTANVMHERGYNLALLNDGDLI